MRNRGKLCLFVVLLLTMGAETTLFAQLTRDENLSRFDDRPLHFGFYLGVNTMDYRFSHYDNVLLNPVFTQTPELNAPADQFYKGVHSYRVECYPLKPGFTVGGVINLRINKVIDLRCTPGMSLGSRQMVFSENINKYIVDPLIGGKLYPGLTYDRYFTTPSAYIDFPIGFRYKGFRHGNLRPYIYGEGPSEGIWRANGSLRAWFILQEMDIMQRLHLDWTPISPISGLPANLSSLMD